MRGVSVQPQSSPEGAVAESWQSIPPIVESAWEFAARAASPRHAMATMIRPNVRFAPIAVIRRRSLLGYLVFWFSDEMISHKENIPPVCLKTYIEKVTYKRESPEGEIHEYVSH